MGKPKHKDMLFIFIIISNSALFLISLIIHLINIVPNSGGEEFGIYFFVKYLLMSVVIGILLAILSIIVQWVIRIFIPPYFDQSDSRKRRFPVMHIKIYAILWFFTSITVPIIVWFFGIRYAGFNEGAVHPIYHFLVTANQTLKILIGIILPTSFLFDGTSNVLTESVSIPALFFTLLIWNVMYTLYWKLYQVFITN